MNVKVLDSVRRREILFNQSAASGSSSTSLPSSSDTSGSMTTCPVCTCPLPCDEGVAEIHVNECLRRAQEEEEGGSGSSEEEGQYYTWCNVTRVRATSLLSPQARASEHSATPTDPVCMYVHVPLPPCVYVHTCATPTDPCVHVCTYRYV